VTTNICLLLLKKYQSPSSRQLKIGFCIHPTVGDDRGCAIPYRDMIANAI
jgi:hypothetical protein